MQPPSSLIFVDLASDDPAAATEFYAKVFGWHPAPRYPGLWHPPAIPEDFTREAAP